MNESHVGVLLNIAIDLVKAEKEDGLFSLFYANCRQLLNSAMDRDQLIDRAAMDRDQLIDRRDPTTRFVQKITAGYRPDLYPKLVDFLNELNERIKGFGRVSWQDEGECVLLIYEDIQQGGLT